MVVVPIKPFGPVVTLLLMRPDDGVAGPAGLGSRTLPAAGVGDPDAALADVALDDMPDTPFATAQDRLVWCAADTLSTA